MNLSPDLIPEPPAFLLAVGISFCATAGSRRAVAASARHGDLPRRRSRLSGVATAVHGPIPEVASPLHVSKWAVAFKCVENSACLLGCRHHCDWNCRSHCYRCKVPVDIGTCDVCSKCNWFVCRHCDACGCGFSSTTVDYDAVLCRKEDATFVAGVVEDNLRAEVGFVPVLRFSGVV